VIGDSARELAMTAVAPDPGYEPHLWLNLQVVERFIPVLAESLAAVDPADAAGYRARGTAALDSLRAFDAWARRTLAPVKDVPFALLHPAFQDFVRRYDLDLVSILQIQPEGELLPRSLGNVVDILTRSGAKVIFAEPQLSARGAETVAHESQARVEMLDPLGGPDLPGRETYLDLLRWNVRSLAEQLGAAKP
jgi:zinc transport system substrate-binding protein